MHFGKKYEYIDANTFTGKLKLIYYEEPLPVVKLRLKQNCRNKTEFRHLLFS